MCQGYNNGNITHSGNLQYSLDLTADLNGVGSGGCTGSATVTGGKSIVAPGSGTIAWNDGSRFCINLDAGDSFKMYHVTGPASGTHVNAGAVIGNVFPAGQGQKRRECPPSHRSLRGNGCASASRTPFAGSARLGCGAPDMVEQRDLQSVGRDAAHHMHRLSLAEAISRLMVGLRLVDGVADSSPVRHCELLQWWRVAGEPARKRFGAMKLRTPRRPVWWPSTRTSLV